MSKSYDNTIPLFAPREQLQKLIAGIVTDSRAPGEPKDTEGSALFQIYQAFATARGNRGAAPGLRRRHRLGRGQAGAVRAHRPRDRADARALRGADRTTRRRSSSILLAGAAKARAHCRALHGRAAPCGGPAQPGARSRPARRAARPAKAAMPELQAVPREATACSTSSWSTPSGALLLQSRGFASPQEAGRAIAHAAERARRRAGTAGRAARTRRQCERRVRQPTHWRRCAETGERATKGSVRAARRTISGSACSRHAH